MPLDSPIKTETSGVLMENVLLVVLLLNALALIGIVLLQRSEGGGLGMGGGGGGGVMSSRGAANALTKATWFLGILFLVVSLAMTVLSARNSGDTSVFDRTEAAPAASDGAADEAPATPALPDVESMMPSTGSESSAQ